MVAKLLVGRFTSPRYNETEPNGPMYYTTGQVINKGANDIVPGSFWANGAQGRVVTLIGYDPPDADVWLASEYADATDYAEWEVTEEPYNPIMLRKRIWVVDIVGLETWFEGNLGRPLEDHEGLVVQSNETTEWDSRLSQLPKTRWTKTEWENR